MPKNKFLTGGLALLTLIIGFFSGTYYTGQKQTSLPTKATVARIIDGDNLALDNGQSLRLYGINCPEKGEEFSKEAIDYLTQTALNQPVTIDYQPNYSKDRWNRLLGYVFINGTFLNQQLVRQGFCEVTLYSKRAKLKYQDELVNAQDQAKQEKLGRWE